MKWSLHVYGDHMHYSRPWWQAFQPSLTSHCWEPQPLLLCQNMCAQSGSLNSITHKVELYSQYSRFLCSYRSALLLITFIRELQQQFIHINGLVHFNYSVLMTAIAFNTHGFVAICAINCCLRCDLTFHTLTTNITDHPFPLLLMRGRGQNLTNITWARLAGWNSGAIFRHLEPRVRQSKCACA